MKLYHGSERIIRRPEYGKGKIYNDYGRGFYCTQNEELAKEWACQIFADGYVNCYELEEKGLKILNLCSEEYSILHWLTILLENRIFPTFTPVERKIKEWLIENYHIDITDYDMIRGYRADDSYFAFARAFVENRLSLGQLEASMRLGELGEQIVLISSKAFEQLTFQKYEIANADEYYRKRKIRDEEARNRYRQIVEQLDMQGIYAMDLIRKGGVNV